MSIIEIALIGIALAMDAFAVSICKGLAMSKMSYKKTIIIALFFGVFQALMPLLGYFLGNAFASSIAAIDHWIAFILLAFIGGKMIYEAIKNEGEGYCDLKYDFKEITLLAFATSIDALAVGISFAFLQVEIWSAASYIGVITFILSIIGVLVGNRFGVKFKSKAEFAGGIILVLIGIKILLEGLGILSF